MKLSAVPAYFLVPLSNEKSDYYTASLMEEVYVRKKRYSAGR